MEYAPSGPGGLASLLAIHNLLRIRTNLRWDFGVKISCQVTRDCAPRNLIPRDDHTEGQDVTYGGRRGGLTLFLEPTATNSSSYDDADKSRNKGKCFKNMQHLEAGEGDDQREDRNHDNASAWCYGP